MFMLLIFLLGLVFGSFVGALTYRLPRGIAVSKGRSYCPKCKQKIAGYDNIPLLSYIILSGRCRNCGKKISPRYPIIEASTAFLFIVAYLNLDAILANLPWLNELYALLFIGSMIVVLFSILIIDLEHQIVPDNLVFIGLGIFLIPFLGQEGIFIQLLWGFISATFLLLLHIATRGRGMGLGDVKLAVLIGAILGYPLSIVWLLLSFIIGGIFGGVLVVLKKATLAQRIAFGPFLVLASFIVAIWGKIIINGFF